MKIEKADAATGTIITIFGAIQLSDINQVVSILVGLATLVAVVMRIRTLKRGGHDDEEDEE